MRTIGTAPGDTVLLLERRDEQVLVHNALVARVCMQEALAGEQGEMAVSLAFVPADREYTVLRFDDVVHMTHRDWIEGRAGLAYEELPAQSGLCRYCRCTYYRPCVYAMGAREQPCFWIDRDCTICSAPACLAKYHREMDLKEMDTQGAIQ